MNSRQLIGVVVAGILVLLGLAYLISVVTTPRDDGPKLTKVTVTVTVPDGLTAQVFTSDGEHGEKETPKALHTVEGTKKITLESGNYRLASAATEQYAEAETEFTVEASPLSVTLKPFFTEKRLTSLVTSERSAILSAIARDTPDVQKYYVIDQGWLYQRGEWYATTLKLKDPSSGYDTDVLRLVARKQNGSWSVVTVPPQLTVSRIMYPAIPEEVATDINNFH